MDLKVSARTDVGRVRELNEDAYLTSLPLLAVADGMGGHNAGEVAAGIALEVLGAWREANGSSASLEEAVREANKEIWTRGRSDVALQGMGTTITAAWVEGTTVSLAHVGDSRAYLLRGDKLEQLTEDQTVVQRWIDEGRIEQEEASHHPYRNMLLQALGIDADVDVETLSLELQPGDRLMISSDGLHGFVPDSRIAELLRQHPEPDAACEALVREANLAGGEDNITVVLLAAAPEASGAAAAGGPVIVSRPTSGQGPEARGRSRRRLAIAAALLGVAIIATVSVLVGASSRASSYIVATNEGRVAIIKGRPSSHGSPPKGKVVKMTDVLVADLPVTYQRQVQRGIVVETLAEAEQTVRDLPRVLGPTELVPPSPTPAISAGPPSLPP